MPDPTTMTATTADESESAPVTVTARSNWSTVNELCRAAIRAWPAGITVDQDKQITAIVRREMFQQVMPLVRETLDAVDELEGDADEGFDDAYARIEGNETRITNALALVTHDAAANALADYVRTHYPEDETARGLADRLTTSLAAVANALAVALASEEPENTEEPVGEPAVESPISTVVPIRASTLPGVD